MRTLLLAALAVSTATLTVVAINTVIIGTSPTADVSDWGDEFCVADTAMDDYPNQQDAKGACIASNHPTSTTVYLRFDFDEDAAPGNGSMDGCWLVDVNQNGNVDRGLCFSVQAAMAVSVSVTASLFTCNDSSSSACGGAAPVASGAACAFNHNVPMSQQLAFGDADDLAVECSVPLTDLGWSTGNVALLQGCSSTSAQPNSATFDCMGSPGMPLIINPETGNNTPVELLSFGIR